MSAFRRSTHLRPASYGTRPLDVVFGLADGAPRLVITGGDRRRATGLAFGSVEALVELRAALAEAIIAFSKVGP